MEAGGGRRGAGLGEKKTDSAMEYVNLLGGFFSVWHCFIFGKILESMHSMKPEADNQFVPHLGHMSRVL